MWRRASVALTDEEPTSKRREATWASSPEKSVPMKRTCRPSFAAMARSSSLSKPVKRPVALMQVLGGASDSVPATSVPGVPSPSAAVFTELNGTTVAVVSVSSSSSTLRFHVADIRSAGSTVALSTPGGAHWLWSAAAGPAPARPPTIRIVATIPKILAP